MVLDQLRDAIDTVVDTDPGALSDREGYAELTRQLKRLEAATARAGARFETEGRHFGSGARTAAHWIAYSCNLPVQTARRRVRLGRALCHMPSAEKAWLAGDIDGAHIRELADVRTPGLAAAFDRDEAELVGWATELRYGVFRRRLAYWAQRNDPDGTEDDAEKQVAGRKLFISQVGDSWVIDAELDPINGAIVAGEIKRIEEEFFEADWAEARARVGEGVCAADLRRNPAQRRADAIVEMATRSKTMPADGRRPAPLFSVFVGYETLAGRICELANGMVVSPGALVGWLNEAYIERVVFGPKGRVTDVGVARRLFEGATRRAVQLSDRECFHQLCEERAEDCQVDHVIPWSVGGPTTVDNGRVACGFHNRDRHRRS